MVTGWTTGRGRYPQASRQASLSGSTYKVEFHNFGPGLFCSPCVPAQLAFLASNVTRGSDLGLHIVITVPVIVVQACFNCPPSDGYGIQSTADVRELDARTFLRVPL